MMNRSTITLVALLSGCFSEEMLPLEDDSESGDPHESSSQGPSTQSAATSVDPTSADSSSDGSTAMGQSETSDGGTSGDEESSSSTGEAPITDFALYFGGDGSVVSMSDVDLDLPEDFTVEAWVRIDSIDAHGTIVQHRGAGTTGWRLWVSSGPSRFYFGYYDNNGVWTQVWGQPFLMIGTGWHHVAAVKHEYSISVYVDGTLVGSAGNSTTAISAPVVPVLVGSDGAEDLLTDLALDDVLVSAGALYTANFEPDDTLVADADTRVFLILDEGDGSLCTDTGSVGAIFMANGTEWTPGNEAS